MAIDLFEKLKNRGTKNILLFSGGSDSVLTYIFLKRLKIKFKAVYFFDKTFMNYLEFSEGIKFLRNLNFNLSNILKINIHINFSNKYKNLPVCYVCKRCIFIKLKKIIMDKKVNLIIGTNTSDKIFFRPGMVAEKLHLPIKPISILKVLSFEKKDVVAIVNNIKSGIILKKKMFTPSNVILKAKYLKKKRCKLIG